MADAYRLLASSALLSYEPVQRLLVNAAQLNERNTSNAETLATEYARLIRSALFDDDPNEWVFLGTPLTPDETRSLEYISLLALLVSLHVRRKCIGSPKEALLVVARRAKEGGGSVLLDAARVRELIKTTRLISALRADIADLKDMPSDEAQGYVDAIRDLEDALDRANAKLAVAELELAHQSGKAELDEEEEEVRRLEYERALEEARQEEQRRRRAIVTDEEEAALQAEERRKAEAARLEAERLAREEVTRLEEERKKAAELEAAREAKLELERSVMQDLRASVARDVSGKLESLYDAVRFIKDPAHSELAEKLLKATTDEQLVQQTWLDMRLYEVFARGYLRCTLKTLQVRQGAKRAWTALLVKHFPDLSALSKLLGLNALDANEKNIVRALWLPAVDSVRLLWPLERSFQPGNQNWIDVETNRIHYDLSAQQWKEFSLLVARVGKPAVLSNEEVFALFERVVDPHVMEALFEHYNVNFKGRMLRVKEKASVLVERLREIVELQGRLDHAEQIGDDRLFDAEGEDMVEAVNDALALVTRDEQVSTGLSNALLLQVFFNVDVRGTLSQVIAEAYEDQSVGALIYAANPMESFLSGAFDYRPGPKGNEDFFRQRANIISYSQKLLCAEYLLRTRDFHDGVRFPLEAYEEMTTFYEGNDESIQRAREMVEFRENMKRVLRNMELVGDALEDRENALKRQRAIVDEAIDDYLYDYGTLMQYDPWSAVYARFMMELSIDFPRPTLKGRGDANEPWSYEKNFDDLLIFRGAMVEALRTGDLWYYIKLGI